MASWLTHLRIAEMIKQKVSEIDFPYLIIGSIAPDSGVPDESQRNYTPFKRGYSLQVSKGWQCYRYG